MKKILSLVLAFAVIFALAACGSSTEPEEIEEEVVVEEEPEPEEEEELPAPDLTGVWASEDRDSAAVWQMAVISGDSVSVYWMTDDCYGCLYWAGSFDAPATADEPYSWDSENDREQTDSAFMAADGDTKTFIYENGTIAYETSIFGETASCCLEPIEEDVELADFSVDEYPDAVLEVAYVVAEQINYLADLGTCLTDYYTENGDFSVMDDMTDYAYEQLEAEDEITQADLRTAAVSLSVKYTSLSAMAEQLGSDAEDWFTEFENYYLAYLNLFVAEVVSVGDFDNAYDYLNALLDLVEDLTSIQDEFVAFITGDDTDSDESEPEAAEEEEEEPEPEPEPESEPEPEETAPAETATTGEQNALSRAQSYLSRLAFSYSGLIRQLEFEGYTTEEATYGADNCGADWYEQAAKQAKNYLNTMAFSYSGLIDQLEFEGYTTEEATYGADNCGADWYEQAAKKAESYLAVMSFSRSSLIDQLEFEGFTHDQAEYGADANGY